MRLPRGAATVTVTVTGIALALAIATGTVTILGAVAGATNADAKANANANAIVAVVPSRRQPHTATATASTTAMEDQRNSTQGDDRDCAVEAAANNDDHHSNKNNDDHHSNKNKNIRALKRQLRLLVVIRCLRAANLAQPLLVPYYSRSLGLKPTGVLWLGSLYSAMVTVAELPSGILSDRLGRKTTLHIAFLGFASSLLLTALASCKLIAPGTVASTSTTTPISISISTTMPFLLWGCLGLAQFARAIGSSMYSGTDMAFLYEVIRKYNNNSNNNSNAVANSMLLSIESRNVFYTTLTEASAAAVGGWLSGAVGLPVVVALAAVPFLLGAVVALFFLESTGAASASASASASTSASTCTTTPTTTTTSTSITATKATETNKPNDKDVAETKNLVGSSGNSGNNNHRSWWGQKTNVGKAPQRTFPFFDTGTKQQQQQHQQQQQQQLQLLRDCVANIPKRVWTLFGIGVALNCGTYAASTALNPLLWETVGIPIGHFGTLHAGCGATSAVGALLAPSLRQWACARMTTRTSTSTHTSTSTRTAHTRGNDAKQNDTSNSNSNSNSTEALLLFMLGTSAVGYGLMALSTTLHGWTTTTTTSATATATVASIFRYNNNNNNNNYHYYYSVSSIGCAILAALLLSLVRGLAWPVLGTAINASIESNGSRATTLSLFSGAIKIGMVLTGMVLGLLFHNHPSTTATPDARGTTTGDSSVIEKGLLHGTILCGMTLASITVWLVGSGVSSKYNNNNDDDNDDDYNTDDDDDEKKKKNNDKDGRSKSE